MKVENYLKNLLALIMAATLSLNFVSCSGNDDEDTNSMNEDELVTKLQGKWEFYGGNETIMGMTITMDKSSLKEMKSMINSATGQKVYIWDETLDFNGYQVNGVRYSLKGSQLIMDGMELFEGFTINIKTVNSTTLVLHEVISMEGIDIVADIEYHKDATDNNNNPNNNDNPNTITTDYTATNSVKTVKLSDIQSGNIIIFYQDYNHRYRLALGSGRIFIIHYIRRYGNWEESGYNLVSEHRRECGIRDIGKIGNISDIISKELDDADMVESGSYYLRAKSTFQPNHGYAVMFTTEEGEKKYMRIYAKDYTLEGGSGSLESVTIDYQLY